MTLQQFVSSKLTRYGIDLSDTEVAALLIDAGQDDPSVDYLAGERALSAKRALAAGLLEVLMQPKSVSEGGYSVTYDKEGALSYYNLLCLETGIDNRLVPTVSDASGLW